MAIYKIDCPRKKIAIVKKPGHSSPGHRASRAERSKASETVIKALKLENID